jgi:hypothetical protein
MQTAVAANKTPEELTLNDLADPLIHQWMRTLESKAIEYGASTGFLGRMMQNSGPALLKASILYENLVVENNRGIAEYGYNDTLIAIYPEDGTVLNDHPFIILDAPWVSEEEKEVAKDYLEFLLRPEIQEKAVLKGFRAASTVDLSEVEETVFRPELGVITNLENITIYDIANVNGEVLQRIPDLWSATRSLGRAESAGTLTTRDFIFPGIILVLMVIMTTYPLIKTIKRFVT